ncbi:MAG: PqqD family protein [Clostridia bacterium]|nr:PqqD family protein [Clostridia bacterium]
MKLNENYVLKTVAGTPVVVPVGEAVNNIRGMITLNGPAEVIWKALENGKNYDEIVAILKQEYDAPEDVLRNDLTAFLDKLENYKILEK